MASGPAPAPGRAAQRRRRPVLRRRAATGPARSARRRSNCSTSTAGTPWSGSRSGSRSRLRRALPRVPDGPAGPGLGVPADGRAPPASASGSGEVWGVHLGWSGNQNIYAERLYHGARLLGRAPSCWSRTRSSSARARRYAHALDVRQLRRGDGCGGRDRFHRFLRGRPGHPTYAASGAGQHLGGGLLRPRAAQAAASWPTGLPRSGSSGSCWTTGGSAGRRDDTTRPRRLVGLRPTSGRRGWAR